MLLVFGGLPGTGKTSIARKLAEEIGAVYIRIDTIEQELINSNVVTKGKIGPAGYFVGFGIARDNLKNGLMVIADSVNPINYTREKWREVAIELGCKILEIELICSHKEEHRKRVEKREIDIRNFTKPSWEDLLNREYDKWSENHIVIDTSKVCINEAIEFLKGLIK